MLQPCSPNGLAFHVRIEIVHRFGFAEEASSMPSCASCAADARDQENTAITINNARVNYCPN
ncbi:MAG: hypothetical protein F4X44_09635 [Gammaproteobacteria bacterium]|nr:hypothetical protein [Gammaproteobacteria bacterium]MYD80858.1 hypothetical protein [Gammaproteobacteria bacterium]